MKMRRVVARTREAARRLWAAPAFRRWAAAEVVAIIGTVGLDLPEEVAVPLISAGLAVLGVADHADTVAAVEGRRYVDRDDVTITDTDSGGER